MTTGEACNDNREILVSKYFELLKEYTNIETSHEEMGVVRNILFRMWQLGWLDRLEKTEKSEVVKCKDCKHRPQKYPSGFVDGDGPCPCICDDCFYSWYPDDNWFCADGERGEDE